MLAAVIPFPSEEVTPPVTKTYFDIGRAPPGVFRMLPKRVPGGNREVPMRRGIETPAGWPAGVWCGESGVWLDVLVELEGLLVILLGELEPDEEPGEDEGETSGGRG